MTNTMNNWWWVVLGALFLLIACGDDHFEAEVPTFLKVNKFEFTTTAEQGSSSSFIRDVWVYENNQFLGAYELPATIPIIGEGQREVTLFPGIREDGSSELPRLFFMYDTDTVSYVGEPGKEVEYTPETEYDERTQFAFIEGFEDGNLFTANFDGNDTTGLDRTDENVFEGENSGVIRVTDSLPTVVVGTANAYGPFFQNGTQVFFEFDYSTDVPVTIGYVGLSEQGEQLDFLKVTLFPTEGWRKAYINFSEEFRFDNIETVQLLIRVDLDGRFGTTSSEGAAYFDNLKLIHF
jgi:hypothetical protein